MKLYNHVATRLSDLEYEMAIHIPEGGNWKNIPEGNTIIAIGSDT